MTTPLPFYISENDPPAKREILRAAMKLFSERGLAATSIRDIAQESGFTNPALYKHFVGKEELALHLFETCHGRDRKSTRLNSSHTVISYAVFCLKKKKCDNQAEHTR